MATWSIFFIVVITFIPISIILTIIPFLTRRTESFGVSVTEEVHALPINKRLRKQYAVVMGFLSGIVTLSICILTAMLEPKVWAVALTIHMIGLTIISFGVYLKYHFAVKRLKEEQQWTSPAFSQRVVVDIGFRAKKVAHSAWWFVPQGVLLLVSVITGTLFYDRFPEQIPMHYDIDGTITRFAEKSYQAVLWPVAVQASVIAMMAFTYFIILRSKQQIDAADPEASLQRNIIFRRRWTAFILVLGFLMAGLFNFMQLSMLFEWSPTIVMIVPLAITGIILIYTIWLSISTGQGGSRIKINGKSAPTGQTNVDDDRYWKLGQIYYNPNDPAYFVEKRFGVGWTINMARPLAWIILLAIIAVPILLTVIFAP